MPKFVVVGETVTEIILWRIVVVILELVAVVVVVHHGADRCRPIKVTMLPSTL